VRVARLLQGLPPEEQRKLVEQARRRIYAAGEVIYREGDPGDALHLILSGRVVAIVSTPDGREVAFSVMGAEEVFGVLALLTDGGPRIATVRALERTETLAIHRREFEHLRQRHRAIADLLVTMLGQRVRRLSSRLREALYLPVEARILRRVVELARAYGGGANEAVIPLTQESIAGLSGTARATVNRILQIERDRGTVSLEKGRIIVHDLAALARRARMVRGALDVEPV
jgi:CRP-like cAMP-binding protein